ncbi:MAG: hypothetical protein JJT77_12615 [Crocinitomicaceae bacterium]|nr:hypothetical protein [Crocinitomicaceae bacterium]
MNIDVTESLIESWLRFGEECQIVQTNYKPYQIILDSRKSKKPKLECLFSSFKKDLEINSSYSQFIKQCENDVLGLKIKSDKTVLYSVEVAFHINGLNYGNNENVIAKKMLRSALVHNLIFEDSVEKRIYFTTPYMRGVENKQKVINDLNEAFNEMNTTFYLIANEQFKDEIFSKIDEKVKKINDNSQLFLRSLKLINLLSASEKNYSSIQPETKILDSNLFDDEELEDKDNFIKRNIISQDLIDLIAANDKIGKRAISFFKLVINSKEQFIEDLIKQGKNLGSFYLFLDEKAVNNNKKKLDDRYYSSNTFSYKSKKDNKHYRLANNWKKKDELLLLDLMEEYENI